MQQSDVKKIFVKLFSVTTIFLLAFSGNAKAGLDSYEIYLNNKLVLKQTVDKPLSLESLQLDMSNFNDQLVIHYSQCNAPGRIGKSRSIIVKDANGNKVKEWKFADGKDTNTGMVIPVKELLQLERKNSGASLSLFYTAEGRPEGQKLAFLHLGPKSTTYNYKIKADISSIILNKFMHP